jgi:ATPase subunit of ABC transporter with duplicated ATPase domains
MFLFQVRAEKRKHDATMAKSNAKRTQDLKKFIMRFGQGNRKMAKQAQSRMKLLEKIQEENVELDFDDPCVAPTMICKTTTLFHSVLQHSVLFYSDSTSPHHICKQ